MGWLLGHFDFIQPETWGNHERKPSGMMASHMWKEHSFQVASTQPQLAPVHVMELTSSAENLWESKWKIICQNPIVWDSRLCVEDVASTQREWLAWGSIVSSEKPSSSTPLHPHPPHRPLV